MIDFIYVKVYLLIGMALMAFLMLGLRREHTDRFSVPTSIFIVLAIIWTWPWALWVCWQESKKWQR